jgi:HSP20 family protein
MRQAVREAAQREQQQASTQAASEQAQRFTPPVDIYEDEQSIALTLEVPGVREADIKIQLEGVNLEVSGERKLAEGQKRESFRRMERVYGSFRRLFRLPTTVSTEQVAASYADGVLTIRLNKRPESQPRTIPVGRA